MRLSGIRHGDIVLCDVRGQTFYAQVHDKGPQALELTELDHSRLNVPYRIVKARQVKRHYSKRKG